MPAVNIRPRRRRRRRRLRRRDPARRGRRRRRPGRDQARRRPRSAAGSRCRATRCGCCGSSACGRRSQAAGYAFDSLGLRAPDPPARWSPSSPTPAPAARTCPPRSACTARTWPGSSPTAPVAPGVEDPLRDHDRRARPGRRRGRRQRSPTASTGRYDLVVGADGVRSRDPRPARHRAGDPRRSGWGSGAPSPPRPASVTRTDLYYGGPCYIAGYCPTGEDSLYATSSSRRRTAAALTATSSWPSCAELSQAYHGPWDDIREVLTDPSRINYTHFETPRPRPALEPRPGRPDRRRRAHLPADPRPGRGHGAGGRRRAGRAAAHPGRRRRQRLWDDVHGPPVRRAPGRSSPPPSSWRSGCWTTSRATSPG